MSRLLLTSLVLLSVAASSASAQKGRRCLLEFERAVTREGVRIEPFENNVNFYAGGDVRLRCQGQNVHFGGDSLESINGDVIRLVTKAYYRDDEISLKADTLTYYKVGERIEMRGHVLATSIRDSSALEGPSIDYLRAVRGVRDSAETVAQSRPTLTIVPKRARNDTASAAPYRIVADLLRGFGSSRLAGRGNVTVDRDDLRGRGDSLEYTTGDTGRTILTGAPATWQRQGTDSFTIKGRDIRLALTDDVLDDVRTFGDGDVVQDATHITGDSVALRFRDGKLARTDAWGRGQLAHVTQDGYDLFGDSVAIATPDEQLRSIQIYGQGMVRNPVDTTAKAVVGDSTTAPRERDTLWGNRIEASFQQADSAGTVITRLARIEARGTARSLISQTVKKRGTTSPTINYARADTIVIVMKAYPASGFAEVRMRGNVDGVQLETASLKGKLPALPVPRRTP